MKKNHSWTQGQHCQEATTRDQRIRLWEKGRQPEGQELSDTLKREGAVAHQVANPHRMVQKNGMVLSSPTSSFTLVQSTLVSSAEQR